MSSVQDMCDTSSSQPKMTELFCHVGRYVWMYFRGVIVTRFLMLPFSLYRSISKPKSMEVLVHISLARTSSLKTEMLVLQRYSRIEVQKPLQHALHLGTALANCKNNHEVKLCIILLDLYLKLKFEQFSTKAKKKGYLISYPVMLFK